MKLIIFMLLMFAAVNGYANLTDGLVAHWSFDNDQEDVVYDESENELHGTSYNVTYEPGPVSRAAVFNGIDSRIYFPDNASAPPDTIGTLTQGSISLWFKFHNTGRSLPFLYYGEADPTRPHNSLIIEVGHGQNPDNTTLYFTIVNRSFCTITPVGLVEATWYHFTAVVSETGNTTYLNGQELVNRRYLLGSDATYTEFFASITRRHLLTLGYGRYGREAPFFHLDGSLDDIRIYNRPLNAEEVRELYEMGFSQNAAAKPVIMPETGNYYAPFNAEIESETPQAEIYYTIDGSEPTQDSHLYEEPITIRNNTTIKAKAFAEDFLPSDVAVANFFLLYPPRNLRAESLDGQINLFWQAPLAADSTDYLQGYNVYRSDDNEEYTLLNEEPLNGLSYQDRDIEAGTYNYYLRTVYQQGESEPSNIVITGTTNVEDHNQELFSASGIVNIYPNPFNPSTVISWSLSRNSRVRLQVFDIRGRLIGTLVDVYKNAGKYETVFTSEDSVSGIYFLRLETENSVHTGKILLLR